MEIICYLDDEKVFNIICLIEKPLRDQRMYLKLCV